MGYSNDIYLICDKIIKLNLYDDQRAMNIVLKTENIDFKIDLNNIIFKNYHLIKQDKIDNSYFISYQEEQFN